MFNKMSGKEFYELSGKLFTIGQLRRSKLDPSKLRFTPYSRSLGAVNSLSFEVAPELVHYVRPLPPQWQTGGGNRIVYIVCFEPELPKEIRATITRFIDLLASSARRLQQPRYGRSVRTGAFARSPMRRGVSGSWGRPQECYPSCYGPECSASVSDDCSDCSCDCGTDCGSDCSCDCPCDCYCDCSGDCTACDCGHCDQCDCDQCDCGCDAGSERADPDMPTQPRPKPGRSLRRSRKP